MKQLQAAVAAWGNSAGFPRSFEARHKKHLEELSELCDAIRYPIILGDKTKEFADLAITVLFWASCEGVDLEAAIREKMPENVAKHGGTWVAPAVSGE